MPITENFLSAADRYWRDANILLPNGNATADHLFGVSAECALKAIMVALSGNSTLPKKYRVHMPHIWDEFTAYSPMTGMHPYTASMPANPFTGWNIGDRYGDESKFPTTRVTQHKNGAIMAMKVLEQARLDGVL